jgi:hypothetical protein
LGTLQWYQSKFPLPTCAKIHITKRRCHGGQPVTCIPEGEESEVSMGETHETKNATSEEAKILADKVAQTMKDALQNNQVTMQRNLEDMKNHLSLGHEELKSSFAIFQRGKDIMIALMEEQSKHQDILSQYLMDKKHGEEPPLFGGVHDVGGSHGGNGN